MYSHGGVQVQDTPVSLRITIVVGREADFLQMRSLKMGVSKNLALAYLTYLSRIAITNMLFGYQAWHEVKYVTRVEGCLNTCPWTS